MHRDFASAGRLEYLLALITQTKAEGRKPSAATLQGARK